MSNFNHDDDRDEQFDEDSFQRSDPFDDTHELPGHELPRPADHHDQDLPEILGLDGKPLEITDEKLHELIDAMTNADVIFDVSGESRDDPSDPRDTETTESTFIVADQILATVGQIEFTNSQTNDTKREACIILHTTYRCHDPEGCGGIHGMDVALRVTEKLGTFLRETGELAEKVAAHGPFPDDFFE